MINHTAFSLNLIKTGKIPRDNCQCPPCLAAEFSGAYHIYWFIKICKECGKPTRRRPSDIAKIKNVFCSYRCSGTFNAKHKTTGANRSKLELWLERQLLTLYPTLEFKFNDTSAIQAELDIYIPDIQIAFELNGIFHYENIFGKLENTQRRDKMKVTLCSQAGIGLCVIDTYPLPNNPFK